VGITARHVIITIIASSLKKVVISFKRTKFNTLMDEGAEIFRDQPCRPQSLPLVGLFDHPWVKRHLH